MTVKELIGYQAMPFEMLGDLRKLYDSNDPMWAIIQGYALGVIMGKRMERERRKCNKQ